MTDMMKSGIEKRDGAGRCEAVRELFSPWLDSEISGEEKDLLEGHLLICEHCRRELEIWKSISATLKDDLYSGGPSPDFSAGVMARLRLETVHEAKPMPKFAIINKLRAPAAAAAAAVMIFAGSWGVHVALSPEKPKTEIVINQPSGNNDSGTDNRVDPVPENTPRPEGPERLDNAGTPVAEPGGNNTGPNSESAAQPNAIKPLNAARVNDVVLLETNKDILSTILKVSVSNVPDAAGTAINIAGVMGGGGQLLSSQKVNGSEVAILRLTVPRDDGLSLVARLSGLGGVIDRADERRNIASSYTEAANRLNEIQGMLEAGAGLSEKSRLEAEASGLKRQIESWNNELKSYVVILWIQK
ncbi:MAG: anti-sigma factor family protein [Bacillota bacterium]